MNYEYRDVNAGPTHSSPTETMDHQLGGVAPATGRTPIASKRAEDAGERLAADMKVFQQVAMELKAKRNFGRSLAERCQQVLAEATELLGLAPTWTAFYREVLGVDGAARLFFRTAEEMRAYEESEEHGKILAMLTALRSRDIPDNDPNEPQRMITVRIPKSLHDSICKEANDLQVSVNKLCITRMLQRVDRDQIPSSNQKRRGRRPGSEYVRSPSPESKHASATPAFTDSSGRDGRDR